MSQLMSGSQLQEGETLAMGQSPKEFRCGEPSVFIFCVARFYFSNASH